MKKYLLAFLSIIFLASCNKKDLVVPTSVAEPATSSVKASSLPDSTKIKILGLAPNIASPSSDLTNGTTDGSPNTTQTIESQLGMSDTVYTLAKINKWNFTALSLPFSLPHWSDTVALNEWMPDSTLYLINNDPMNGFVALQKQFLANPQDWLYLTLEDAVFAAQTQLGGGHNYLRFPGDPGETTNYAWSLNTFKWVSTIYMQNQIKNHGGKIGILNYSDPNNYVNGIKTPKTSDNQIHSSLEPIWLVGDIYRRSLEIGGGSGTLPDAAVNAAKWYYAGWLTNYGITTSTNFTANGNLTNSLEYESYHICHYISMLGYPQLANAIALKSLVNRPNNVYNPFDDIKSIAVYGDPNTYTQSMDFALTYVLGRLKTDYYSIVLYNSYDKSGALACLNDALSQIQQNNAQSPKQAQFLSQINEIISIVQGM